MFIPFNSSITIHSLKRQIEPVCVSIGVTDPMSAAAGVIIARSVNKEGIPCPWKECGATDEVATKLDMTHGNLKSLILTPTTRPGG